MYWEGEGGHGEVGWLSFLLIWAALKVRAHRFAATKFHLHIPSEGNEMKNDPEQGRDALLLSSDVGMQGAARGGDPETSGDAGCCRSWSP